MDLLLRGRGADIGARAPLWLIRLSGAALTFGAMIMADRLGLSAVTGLSPLLLRGGALVVGALLAPTAYGALLWMMTGVLVCVSMLVAFTPVARISAQQFVRRDATTRAVDAIVVLSGAMNEEGHINGQGLDRLLTGVAEARRRGTGTLALSVIEHVVNHDTVSSEADQRALLALMAPDIEVRFVRNVKSTRDEALMFTALANTYGWHRVAVVTSPLHTRRACRTVEVAGLSVECVPAEPREYSLGRLHGVNGRLHLFEDIMYESAATIVYKLRGWN